MDIRVVERHERRALNKQLLGIPEDGSRELELWRQNQRDSPLLRLPAEIRNRIYDLVLYVGIITVHRGSENWEQRERHGFWCQRIDVRRNPFGRLMSATRNPQTRGMTILSPVCRQLYHETVLLPYQLNAWCFTNYAVMERFVMRERRLPKLQRRAIHTLYVHGRLGKKTEKFFGGLKVIVWGDQFSLQAEVLGENARQQWEDLPAGGRVPPPPSTFPPPHRNIFMY